MKWRSKQQSSIPSSYTHCTIAEDDVTMRCICPKSLLSRQEWEKLVPDWEKREDRPHEECGVFGIYAPGEDVARITFFGLYALQHRGQESAGIATLGGDGQVGIHRKMGLVAQVFTEPDLLGLQGNIAIGHTRYSTTGSSRIENAQPIVMESTLGPFALAHNGNLTNTSALRQRLLDAGETLTSSSDSEILAKLLALAPGSTWIQKIRHTMREVSGAYSLVM